MREKHLTIIILEDDTASGKTATATRFRRALDAAVSTAGEEKVTLICGAEAARRCLQPDDIRGAVLPSAAEGSSVLFAISLPADGINNELSRFLRILRTTPDLLENTTGAILVDGAGPLYTKSVAAQLAFAANNAGCTFIGRPLVEATGDLSNFHIIADRKSVV